MKRTAAASLFGGVGAVDTAVFELYPENRLPMFMTFVGCALFVSWVIVNVPEAFTAGVSYLALLTIAALAYLASASARIGAVMDFGDPGKAYYAIGTGFTIGFAVVLPVLIKIVSPIEAAALPPGGLTAMFVCFVAPVVEELFFGGVILPVFTYIGGAIIGIAMTSLLFALFHYAVYGVALAVVVYLALFRAVVSAIQLQYGGIAPGIYAHLVVNTVSYVLSLEGGERVMSTASALLFGGSGSSLASAVSALSLPIVLGVTTAVVMTLLATRWWNVARKVGAALLIAWAVVGIYAVSVMICLYGQYYQNPPETVTVELLGTTMVLPWRTFLVLIPCHLLLIPWTIVTAVLLYREDPDWVTSMLYMTLFSTALTITENAFRGPGTVIVLCICLFDTITDYIMLALAKYFGEL